MTMTHKFKLFCSMALLAALASCTSSEVDEAKPSDGKARLSINLDTDAGFATRTLNEEAWRKVSNYTVEITDGNNDVIESFNAASVPSPIELENGTYTVRAYYGEEHVASRSQFLSECVQTLSLNVGDEQAINMVCEPTCGKVKVNFGADMATYFSDYYVTFSTPKMDNGTTATWTKDDTEPWYLAVAKGGDVVTATIHLTLKEEYAADSSKGSPDLTEGTVVRTYTLQRNKAWTLGIAPDYTSSNGTIGVSITIDDSVNEHEVDVVIPAEWID